MKKIILVLIISIIFSSCNSQNNKVDKKIIIEYNKTRKEGTPTYEALKDRIINAMKKEEPNLFVEKNFWRIKIVKGSYKKTTNVETWMWTYESNINDDGEYYLYTLRYEDTKGAYPTFFPNIELDVKVKRK